MPFGYLQKVDPASPMNRSTYSLVQRLLPWWSGGFDPFLHLASDYSIPLIAASAAVRPGDGRAFTTPITPVIWTHS